MVQLHVISGRKAGHRFAGSGLPLVVGRAAESDFLLEDPGVWPRHFQILREDRDLVCRAETNALLSVNDVQTGKAVLRNGDIISIGALKLQFTLSAVRQSDLQVREWLVWSALALLCLGQVLLAGHLLR